MKVSCLSKPCYVWYVKISYVEFADIIIIIISGPCGSRRSWCTAQIKTLDGDTGSRSEERKHHSADGPVGVCEYTEEGTVHLSLVVLDGWQLFTDQES